MIELQAHYCMTPKQRKPCLVWALYRQISCHCKN